ncbi:YdcF family protein [Fulvivirga maritima]|uniref:YdcF family protein n=1 Tax=Fulvivirga maritima TaxID=2904247 RepID=UPI001F32B529|nr:YdcF family protein [Fulvivirga maritima]UII28865.1 YdcF family protein [Fulvivirga maritima]
MIKKFFKYKVVRIILWLHVAAIVIIAGLILYLTHFTDKAYKAGIEQAPYDAIIVPGYPYTGSWHDIMKTRVYWAAHLWETGVTKHIIFSGGAVYSPYVESVIMKQYAKELGVPAEVIFTEMEAEHSTENLFYSYQIALKQGFEKVALATDPVQSFFLNQYADNKAYNLGYLPIQYNTIEAKELKDFTIDDKVAFIENFEALPDRESFWTRMEGTLGGNIEYLEVDPR